MGSWADHAIEQLKLGNEVEITPHGQSMKGKVESGQKVLLAPSGLYQPGDIVLVKCKGNIYLHLIKAEQGRRLVTTVVVQMAGYIKQLYLVKPLKLDNRGQKNSEIHYV